MSAPRVVGGVFVGGASRRMGGRVKGLLAAPDGTTLVARAADALRNAGVSDLVLVGRHPAYAALGLPLIDDRPPGVGPLGGLVALLEYAEHAEHAEHAKPPRRAVCLAIACDMPFVSAALLRRLLAASAAPIVAPRRANRWEPLCARYDARVLPIARRRAADQDHSLQRLLDEAGAIALPLAADEGSALDDWDTPDDVIRHGSRG